MRRLTSIGVIVVLLPLFGFSQKCGTYTDVRDGHVYKTVEIGKALWFAQNLAFTTRASWCYQNEDDSCKKYGRIYMWNDAMANSMTEGAQGICPEGWHVPSNKDWDELMHEYKKTKDLFVGGISGFDMEAGGCRFEDGTFSFVGKVATYWTSSLDASYPENNFAFTRYAYIDTKNKPLFSYSTNVTYGQYLRCVKNK